MKFIQLTDLHIGNHGETEEKNLKQLVRHIRDTYTPDDICAILITGDFVHNREPASDNDEYTRVRKILAELKEEPAFKILTCPGNHDYGQGGSLLTTEIRNYYDMDYRKRYASEIHNVLERGITDVEMESWNNLGTFFPREYKVPGTNIVFIGLDTMHGNVVNNHSLGVEKHNRKKHSGRGWIDQPQLDALNTKLTAYEGHTKIVYMHHHLHEDIAPKMDIHPHANRIALKKCLEDHKVDLVCYGHLHIYYSFEDPEKIKLSISGHNSTQSLGVTGNELQYHLYTIEDGRVTIETPRFNKINI